MATIALYANKINQMPGLIKDVKKSVVDYQSELSALKKQSLKINQSICNLNDVISSIQASSQTQEQKIASLETFQQNSEQFIVETARIDSDVADVINQRKDDFYEEYYYLKPECEKNGWEKFCEGCKKVGEWCKEHWKEILLALEVIVAVACLFIPGAQGFGVLLLKHIVIGILKGFLIGAVIGGISGYAQYGVKGILGGMLNGAIEGALLGGIFGGISGMGTLIHCGTAIKTIHVVTTVLSIGMAGFDILALGELAIMRLNTDTGLNILNTGGVISDLNKKAHSNAAYNVFQFLTTAVAVTTASATCFVAGTMILTASGLVAIENIKAGDKVISTEPETFETAEKTVLETYVRKVSQLVHLIINEELITTTGDHPFYVKDLGFVNAGELYVGDKLLDLHGNTLIVADRKEETLDEAVKVYNFKVEDFHTYYAGENCVLVHNAGVEYESGSETDNLALKGKGYSPEYAQKLKNAYKIFKDNGYEISEHGLNRIFGRINQGKIGSIEEVLDVLKNGTKYIDTVNGGTVLYKNGISIHIVEDSYIKTVIGNAKIKSTWEVAK